MPNDTSNFEIQKELKNKQGIEVAKASEMFCDTLEINAQSYIGCYNYENYFFIIDEKSDTVYKHNEWIIKSTIIDFNDDGLSDFLLDYMTNTPHNDLIMYDSKSKQFRIVEDFYWFPAPIKIKGTDFYYSYHRSGCADSLGHDLFVIKDFQAIKIGNISIGCEGRGTGIFISKIKGREEKLIQEILRKPGYFEDKWEFIEDYWTNNCKKFK